MSRIAISLCGEGRGHATRIATLIDRLDTAHEILVYTSADALAFLHRQLGSLQPRVRLEEIPGVVFQYTAGRLDVMRSIAAGLDYQARQLGPLVDRMMGELEAFGADVAITTVRAIRTMATTPTASQRPRSLCSEPVVAGSFALATRRSRV